MIKIEKIVSNPPGRDTTDRLNEEYVEIKNTGSLPVDMTGWQLKDAKGHTYRFTGILGNRTRWQLGVNEFAVVHTGSGIDHYTGPTPGYAGTFHLYWGRGWFVWNNQGDTAYLHDQFGRLVDSKTV